MNIHAAGAGLSLPFNPAVVYYNQATLVRQSKPQALGGGQVALERAPASQHIAAHIVAFVVTLVVPDVVAFVDPTVIAYILANIVARIVLVVVACVHPSIVAPFYHPLFQWLLPSLLLPTHVVTATLCARSCVLARDRDVADPRPGGGVQTALFLLSPGATPYAFSTMTSA